MPARPPRLRGAMIKYGPWDRVLFLYIAVLVESIFRAMSQEVQKLKSQADDLEDKGAQAIDDGNMDQGLDFMVQAIALDPLADEVYELRQYPFWQWGGCV